jgi:heme/copper-type cytochrome/quinol oxidase subunit 2
MEIKVVSEDEYEDWLASNKDFVTKQKELTASAE